MGTYIRVVFSILFGSSRVSGSSLFMVYACDLLCDSVCVPVGIILCVTFVLYVEIGHVCDNLLGKYIPCVVQLTVFLLSFSTLHLCHCL